MAGVKSKLVDGCKYREYLLNNNLKSSHICIKAGLNHTYGTNTTAPAHSEDGEGLRCRVNEVYWNLICDVLEVPRDYFDAKEHKPEPVKETVAEDEQECLVDLADIQLSVNKIEGLLLKTNALLEENNRLLRGKLERGEKNESIKGNANDRSNHSYTISHVRDLQ